MDLTQANNPIDLLGIIGKAIKSATEESRKLDDLAKFMGEQQDKLNALKTNPCDECEVAHTSCCCNAEIIMGDICADCREHTDDCCDECELKDE